MWLTATNRTRLGLALVTCLLIALSACATEGPSAMAQDPPQAAQSQTIEARFKPPAGFNRVAAEQGSFAAWLRRLPLKPGSPPVRLYNGELKANQTAHCAVVDMAIGARNLQQCADAVIRLRAEYLFASGCEDQISFRFTSGHPAAWKDWRSGMRPVVTGSSVVWRQMSAADGGYANFERYLDIVFTYAGSASLARELDAAPDPSLPAPGDVFIHGGYPGHAAIVVDVAENASGQRVFLLAQSYMPAQEIHLLKNPADESTPWYQAARSGWLETPEWTFRREELRKFRPLVCPPQAAAPDSSPQFPSSSGG